MRPIDTSRLLACLSAAASCRWRSCASRSGLTQDCAALGAHQPKSAQGATFLPYPDGVSVALVGSLADPIFAAFAGSNSVIVLVMGGAHGA